jgi:uncharacterized membrane protein YedE/YeeE
VKNLINLTNSTTRDRAFVVGAGVTGILFGVGLVLSGMTKPDKVIGFLDVFSGNWDPSLGLVMVGAIAVHAVLFRLILRRKSPLLDAKFHVPTRTDIDPRLVAGAALFGIGWGLGGVCPGPGLIGATSLASTLLLFVGGLIAGMALFQVTNKS